MNVPTKLAIGLGAALALAAVSPAVADHGDLSGDQIKQLLSGATSKLRTDRGANVEVQYAASGNVSVNSDTGFSDSGKWSVEGDNYCAEMTKIRNGRKGCWEVRHLNGNDYLFKGLNGTQDVKANITQ